MLFRSLHGTRYVTPLVGPRESRFTFLVFFTVISRKCSRGTLARISAEGMFIFHEDGGFLVLENPECLQMMQLWFIAHVVTSINASEVVVHYGVGALWRMPTTFGRPPTWVELSLAS